MSARRFFALLILISAGGTVGLVLGSTRWGALVSGGAGILTAFHGEWSVPWLTLGNLFCGGGTLALIFGVGATASFTRGARRYLPLRLERVVFAMLIGGLFVSTAIVLAGLISLRMAVMGPVCLGLAVAGLRGWYLAYRDFAAGRKLQDASPSHGWFKAILAIIFGISALYACAPAVESDELRYHLSALFIWKMDGRIHYIPYQAFSNFPMLGEMLFLAVPGLTPMSSGAAKLIHLAYLAVSLGLMVLITLRLMRPGHQNSRSLSWLAALAFACTPCVPVLAAWGFVDFFMIGYFLGFVYAAGRMAMHPRQELALLVGLTAAGAVATKYSMVPLTGMLGLLLLLSMALKYRGRRQRIPRLAGIIAGVAALVGGVWYLRNFLWTGNPFYPLASSIFPGGEWNDANASFYAYKAAEKGFWSVERLNGTLAPWALGAFGKVVEFLMTPWTTAFYFDRFESHPIGLAPLLLFWLAVGGIVLPKQHTGTWTGKPSNASFRLWIIFCALLSWGFWFVTYQSNRLLLPAIGLVIPLGIAALQQWRAAFPRVIPVLQWLIGSTLVFGFLLWLYILGSPDPRTGFRKADAIAVAIGTQSADLYLKRQLNYYPAAQWLNAYAAESPGKALLVGEHRTLYFELPVVASDWFDTPQPLPWIRSTADNDAMFDALLGEGVRYLFYNQQELDLYRELYFKPRFSQEEYARYRALIGDESGESPREPRLKVLKEFVRPPFEHVFIFEILPGRPGPAEGSDRRE